MRSAVSEWTWLGTGARAAVLVGVVVLATACSSSRPAPVAGMSGGGSARSDAYDPKTGTSASPRLHAEGDAIPKGGGHYKLGQPYKVSGRWYVPREEPGYDRQGIASWYGREFHGRKTANGEIFDMNALTAAHPTLPLPSYAYVTNLDNDRTVLVRINDRGPYAHDRIIDLSRQVARVIGTEQQGLGRVRVRYAGRAPLDGDDRRERAHLAAQPWARDTYQVAEAPKRPWQPWRLGGPTLPKAPLEPGPSQLAPGERLVDAGLYRDRENAERIAAELSAIAAAAVASEDRPGAVRGHRVLIGPLAEAEAAKVRAKLVARGLADARLLANRP